CLFLCISPARGALPVFFFQAEDGIRDRNVTGVQTCALPIYPRLPDGPRDLTITIGLGPRPVQALGPELPGAEDLPEFHSDEELSDQMRGGDLFVSCYSSDPNDVLAALREVGSAVDGMSLRWLQRCFRPHGEGTIARNPLTFYDGIIV